MKTCGVFVDLFTARTTGVRRMFTVSNLTLDAVKVVLKGVSLKLDTDGAEDDCNGGYLRRCNLTGYYGGNDGYVPTAKGYRAILSMLQ